MRKCRHSANHKRYRLSVNHHLIPLNAARCPVHSYHRDDAMRVEGDFGGALGYECNGIPYWLDNCLLVAVNTEGTPAC